MGLSAVLAPLLGAFFVETLSWHWIFYINIPICMVSFILLQFYRETFQPKPATIDFAGMVLFSGAISLLLLTTVVESGYALYAVLGAVLLVVFYLYERRLASPVIPLFLQHEGFSLFVSGIALLGMSFGWMAVAVPAGKWILRWGYKPLIIIANVLLIASGALLLFLAENTSFFYVFLAMIVQGMSFGLLSTVSIIGSQQLVEPHQKGVSTSLQLFSRNIGTSIGVTVMGALLNRTPDFYSGIHSLFIYGFAVSLAAFATSFSIRMKAPAKMQAAAE